MAYLLHYDVLVLAVERLSDLAQVHSEASKLVELFSLQQETSSAL